MGATRPSAFSRPSRSSARDSERTRGTSQPEWRCGGADRPARHDLDAVAVPLPGQGQTPGAVVVGGRDHGAGVLHRPQGVLQGGVGTAGLEDDVGAHLSRRLLDRYPEVGFGRVVHGVGPVAGSPLAAHGDRVGDGHPARPADPRQLRHHLADGPEPGDGDAVPEPHRGVAHRSHGEVGRVPVDQGLRRHPVRRGVQPRRRHRVGLADRQVAEDPVPWLEAAGIRAHLLDGADAHVPQGHREPRGSRLAAAVQAQPGIEAVAGVGGVGAESAQLGAVLDRAEPGAHAHLPRLERRFFVLPEQGVSGAVGDQFEGHCRIPFRRVRLVGPASPGHEQDQPPRIIDQGAQLDAASPGQPLKAGAPVACPAQSGRRTYIEN